MTREEMISLYNALTAAEGYILGFLFNHEIYYLRLTHLPENILKFDRASSKRGGMAKIRVRLSAKERAEYAASGNAVRLADEEEFTKETRYNKGEVFEKLVTEKLTGESWRKDSVPFNVAGDIRLAGKEIQVKFDQAELTNEKVLARVLAIA